MGKGEGMNVKLISSLKVGENWENTVNTGSSMMKHQAQLVIHLTVHLPHLDKVDEIESWIEFLTHTQAFLTKLEVNGDPKSRQEAMRRLDRQEWKKAGEVEVVALVQNKTWVLIL
jgi:hypothetical protein